MRKVIVFTFLADLTVVQMVAVTLVNPQPFLVWNATASAPKGLY
jgi:type IV secretory pathway protease TraF